MTNLLGRRLLAGVVVATLAVAGCSTPVVTPVPSVSTSVPQPTPALTLRPTPGPTATPQLTPAPSLAAISPSDIGPGPWTVIATATYNGTGGPDVGVLGGVGTDFAYILTCAGRGTLRVTLGASTKAMGDANPPASPVMAGSGTYECPGTEIFTEDTGMFEGGGWFISPNVDASAGVIYQLLVVTAAS